MNNSIISRVKTKELADHILTTFGAYVTIIPETVYCLQCKENPTKDQLLRIEAYISGWIDCDQVHKDSKDKIVLSSAPLPTTPQKLYRAYYKYGVESKKEYLYYANNWSWTPNILQAKLFTPQEVMDVLIMRQMDLNCLKWEEVISK